MAEQRLNVSVDNGKYTVIMESDGRLIALRHGDLWQDLCGNKLIYSLAAELDEARKRLAEVRSWVVGAGLRASAESMQQNAARIADVLDLTKPYEEPTHG